MTCDPNTIQPFNDQLRNVQRGTIMLMFFLGVIFVVVTAIRMFKNHIDKGDGSRYEEGEKRDPPPQGTGGQPGESNEQMDKNAASGASEDGEETGLDRAIKRIYEF